MDKEEILEISRRENQNRDLAELEAASQAGNIAGRVGAGVCCLISVIFHRFTGTLLYSPWVIYFSILWTHYAVKSNRTKRRSDVSLSALYLAMCLLAFVFFVLRLAEVTK